MGFIKKVRGFISQCDLFSQPISLRFKEDPQYKTCSGGFCSIVLVIVFVAIFFGTALQTVNKTNISSTTTEFQEEDPSYYNTSIQSKFMFAVGINGINLNSGERYFDIKLQKRNYSANGKIKTSISLQKCERNQWDRVSEKFGALYDRLNFTEWLCPHDDILIQLQGKFTSQVFQHYKFSVNKCSASLDPTRPCTTDANINSYLAVNQAFSFNFYFVNTLLNPGTNQVISYYLQDRNYFPFSPTTGVSANLFFESYTIQTDQSILPYEDMQQITGGIVRQQAVSFTYDVKQTQYLRFYLRKSSISLSIHRQFRKADDTISYVGGLFSAIITLLIFMGKYNELSYQLELSKSLYNQKEHIPINDSKFNLLGFIGYGFYSFLDLISVSPAWQTMKNWDEALQQVRKQMDVRLIMKKLIMFQRVLSTSMDKFKYDSFQYCQNQTLDDAKQVREKYKGRKRIRKRMKFKSTNKNSQENDKDIDNFKIKQNYKNIPKNKVAPMQITVEQMNAESIEDELKNQERNLNLSYESKIDDNINVYNQNENSNQNDKENEVTNQIDQSQKQEKNQEEFKKLFENLDQLHQKILQGDQMSFKILQQIDPKIKKYYQKSKKLQKRYSNVSLDDSDMVDDQEK